MQSSPSIDSLSRPVSVCRLRLPADEVRFLGGLPWTRRMTSAEGPGGAIRWSSARRPRRLLNELCERDWRTFWLQAAEVRAALGDHLLWLGAGSRPRFRALVRAPGPRHPWRLPDLPGRVEGRPPRALPVRRGRS